MSATVYGASRYGLTDDSSASGLHAGNLNVDSSVEEAMAKNHIGCDVSIALYNDGSEGEIDGVVAVKATGLATNLASVLVLANFTADSLDLRSANLFTTPVANAGALVRTANLRRTNTGFEEGSLGFIYKPLIATNSPTVLT